MTAHNTEPVISFTSSDSIGMEQEYAFRSVALLKEQYCSSEYDLPFSDDEISNVKIKGVPVKVNTFYDLLKLIGIIG